MRTTATLSDLLTREKASVLEGWFESIAETYPLDARSFLKSSKHPFQNPVGTGIAAGIEILFDALAAGGDLESKEVTEALDIIVRTRAVQQFAPSAAIGFLFFLKKVVREELGRNFEENAVYDEMLKFESRIDDLSLMAFDIYMACREKIFEIKAVELRNRTSRILDGACRKFGMPSEW